MHKPIDKNSCNANIRKLAELYNVELNEKNANNSKDTQFTQLQTLLEQGYKYFLIQLCDTSSSGEFNTRIYNNNQYNEGAAVYSGIIPTAESLKVDSKSFFFAGSSDTDSGKYQGGLIADYFDKYPSKAPGKVIRMFLMAAPTSNSAYTNRKTGLQAELQRRGYTVTIVTEEVANWEEDTAKGKMDTWLGADPSTKINDINVVVAQNDHMALGAVASLIEKGLTKTDTSDGTKLVVPVLGIDAADVAIESMKRNELYATVLQDANGQSAAAINLIYQVATGTYSPGNRAGGTPAATTPISEAPANDSAVIGQCYLVPFMPVDKASSYFKSR